ncbi:MAG TPA: 2,3-butanediol dehydrogenase [Solirubrobacterales bacterium]|nr:2,3-butanediol dehydrogenase [Solirubrobacterales bacterium]
MRAARYYGAKDIRVEEVAEPNGDLGPTQVLIAPRQVGICGTDLHEYVAGPIVTPAEPHPLTGAELPQILGHELSADVVAVGAEVTNVVPGDRISVMPLVFCGKCYFCRRGLNHLCVEMGCFGLSWDWGGMAGLGVVESYQAWPLPDEVSYEQGALVEPGAVAEWGVKQAGVGPGDTVLVAGAGPIGALTVLAAQAAGAGAVYLSEPNGRRAARAANLGAAAIFDPTATDVVGEVRERTEGLGVDVAIECAGNERALRACLDAVRAHGTVAQVGLHVKDAAIDAMELSHRELTLVGTWCFSVHDWPRIIGLVASGAYPVERAVSDHASLERVVEDGFEQLIDPAGDQIKILVETK